MISHKDAVTLAILYVSLKEMTEGHVTEEVYERLLGVKEDVLKLRDCGKQWAQEGASDRSGLLTELLDTLDALKAGQVQPDPHGGVKR